jgi:hypothetical protein
MVKEIILHKGYDRGLWFQIMGTLQSVTSGRQLPGFLDEQRNKVFTSDVRLHLKHKKIAAGVDLVG